jgi:lipopolysaccharide O-acetyltransferase
MLNKYGFVGSFKLLVSFVVTKLLFRKARLIRLPFDIRNRKYINLGNGLTTGFGCRIEALPKDNSDTFLIIFGNNVQINDYVHISAMEKVIIGNNVLMASKIYISDNSHGIYKSTMEDSNPNIEPIKRTYFCASIIIEDNVWIGENVVILPGIIIGKGSIIGANSVVSKSIPPNVIAVGSPARPKKKFNFNTQKWEKI